MASISETYRNAGSSPLPADAPDSAWVRDESLEFARINAEIAKFESLIGKETPDWSALIRTSGELIRIKSKDLLAISYLCRGLFEREHYEGLAAGLQVLADVVDLFWENAYPPMRRTRRRGNEIEWLINKLVNPVSGLKPTRADSEAVYRATDLLVALEEKLKNYLKVDAPVFRKLREVLVGYRDELAAEQEQEEKAAAEAKSKEAATLSETPADTRSAEGESEPRRTVPERPAAEVLAPLTAPGVVAVGSENDIRKAVKETRLAVQQIAAYWRSRKLSDPRPYTILRFAAWMDVAAPPKIPLPGPTKNQVGECKRLLEEESHCELIEFVEGVLSNPDAPPNCHWLDGHRYTATALAALGEEYARARAGVIGALRYYLANFPGTLDMRYTTEVDYADPQTKVWIQAEVIAGQIDVPSGGGATIDRPKLSNALSDVVNEARALAAKGANHAAVAVFQKRIVAAESGRKAFALSLEQARFCAKLGYSEVAASLLEGLREKTNYYHLDQWEPELSVETIKLLLETLPKAAAAEQTRAVELRSRLAHLDAVAAMEVLPQS